MTAAALAEDFHPAHTVAGVRRFAYRLIINSREKTRPAGAGIVLGLGIK